MPFPTTPKTPSERIQDIIEALIKSENALATISNRVRLAKKALAKLAKEQDKTP